MLNFIKKLFGKTETAVEVKFSPEAQKLVDQVKGLEFHEEMRVQVDAEKAKANKPAKKPAAKKPAAKKAPAKIKAEKKPAKKPAKKSK